MFDPEEKPIPARSAGVEDSVFISLTINQMAVLKRVSGHAALRETSEMIRVTSVLLI
jgi:hypothetical protein